MAVLSATVAGELRSEEFAGRCIELRIGEMPSARCDEAMIRQVLACLIGNALKFTAPTPQALIELGGAADSPQNVYWVRDNGVGFNEQFSNKLFGVFQRLHGAEEFEGTGMGLAIVKRIIERHGGRVWAESKLGEGAVFHFALPAAPRLYGP
jgi:two-component system, chemotaxis family, sensor kinase Cph1